ncbi:hypothetical protein [Xanthomonas vasicola]|uniref:hypothetical protein n=1 Tax=Xanthomonas vasicola TaxID=56459 RepID=UPI001C47662B|nr:hypothetical protein [Xanthomonas vasicola]MBV6747219.1 hypothetical protein [Xanthomonas vasicola pv. vasculorum NCPPB 890]MBV6892711.1 hypothetical protein [Xanthomonas vasicola pv. vasculorum]MDO6948364.1 hypothetical protein [Xanthomonas vasicola]MDO6960461.1 hypothetical protein [Xanthomonas vasicola]
MGQIRSAIKPRLPVDIPLPENTPLEGGAMFVRLLTLDALESFWRAHRSKYQYAAKGIGWTDGQTYLDEYEWVFASTKSALVKAFTRWGSVWHHVRMVRLACG